MGSAAIFAVQLTLAPLFLFLSLPLSFSFSFHPNERVTCRRPPPFLICLRFLPTERFFLTTVARCLLWGPGRFWFFFSFFVVYLFVRALWDICGCDLVLYEWNWIGLNVFFLGGKQIGKNKTTEKKAPEAPAAKPAQFLTSLQLSSVWWYCVHNAESTKYNIFLGLFL